MPSAPSIAFDIRPSRVLAGAAVLMLLSGCASVLIAGLLPLVQGLLCAMVVAAGTWALRRYVNPHYVRASGQGGEWMLLDVQGRSTAAAVRGYRRLGPFVQIDFDLTASRFTHLLAPDNSDADARRRLLLVLAHGSLPQAR